VLDVAADARRDVGERTSQPEVDLRGSVIVEQAEVFEDLGGS
jgi:hypothetical protein